MAEPARDGRIAFVFAMPLELEPLVRALSLTETQIGGVPMYEGSLDGREVIAVVTGMGTELAAAGTLRLLDAVPVRWVLVVGITGALDNDTPIGTLVLPEIVVNSETGREFPPAPLAAGTPPAAPPGRPEIGAPSKPGRESRPAPLADAKPFGKMWTTNGLTTDERY